MSTTVTYAGNQYQVPAYQDTGYAQGTGNLSSYLIALATGSLTVSGGSFPLTAEADFGSSYGLKAIYYKAVGPGLGLTVTTPDGLHTYRIAVDNDGSITTEQLT